MVANLFARAIQYHQTGQLSQAEQLYRQILQQQPHHVEALRLLGVIAYQTGNVTPAIDYFQRVITLRPDHAEAHNNLGSAFRQLGNIQAAIAHLQQAVTLNPNLVDAHYNLGNALQEHKQWQQAIPHYEQVLTLKPTAEAHSNLANALMELGQIEPAIAHYQQAIALKPSLPTPYYNLGNVLRDQGQLENAIHYYQQAIALNPNNPDIHYNLGLVRFHTQQYEAAIAHYQQALQLDPDLPDVYYNLARAILALGNHPQAVHYRQQAVKLTPREPDAHTALGWALLEQEQRHEEAYTCFQQALAIDPNFAPAHYGLGQLLTSQNKTEAAIAAFQTACQLDSTNLEAYLRGLLVLPIVYESQAQMLQARQRFCRGLNQLQRTLSLETEAQRQQALAALTRHTNFYLAYQGLGDRGLQRKYGNLVSRIMAANYPQWAVPLTMPPVDGKIRVGYVSAFFREHVVTKLTAGWLQYHDADQFEIYTYYLGTEQDAVTEAIQAVSDRFYAFSTNLEVACKQIRADNLHILIFNDLGMIPISLRLGGLRLAPVQCTSWAHPITSGLPTIDYFLSGDLMEPEHGQQHYSEQLIRLPNLGICYAKPTLPAPTQPRAAFSLRDDAVVYLTTQFLCKYLPQFDWIFPHIAQQVPQTQFVFLTRPSEIGVVSTFQTRLQEAFASMNQNWQDYCIFLPRLNHTQYWNLNQVADVFLDTIGWSAGNTALEAIACGLPIVTHPTEFMRGRHSCGILHMMGITDTIAQTIDDYVAIAIRLGIDPAWRKQLIEKIHQHRDRLYGDRTCITALEAFYEQVINYPDPQNSYQFD